MLLSLELWTNLLNGADNLSVPNTRDWHKAIDPASKGPDRLTKGYS